MTRAPHRQVMWRDPATFNGRRRVRLSCDHTTSLPSYHRAPTVPCFTCKRIALGLCPECGAELVDGACPNAWDNRDGFKTPPRGKHARSS